MFVQKDLRKIHAIVNDTETCREELRLGRRAEEFQGKIHALCSLENLGAFSNLQRLSLYDNKLRSIEVQF
jgi:hypothetical protein